MKELICISKDLSKTLEVNKTDTKIYIIYKM